MKQHVKYSIKRQSDGSFVILQKDLTNKRLTINSTHDTYGEAASTLDNLQSKPTQEELLNYFNGFKQKIKQL